MKNYLSLIFFIWIFISGVHSFSHSMEYLPINERNSSLLAAKSRQFTPVCQFYFNPILLYNTTNDGFFNPINGYSLAVNSNNQNNYLFYSVKNTDSPTRQKLNAFSYTGDLLYNIPISSGDYWEYPGSITTDPVTGIPFYVWTGDYPGVNSRALWIGFENNQIGSARSLIANPISGHYLINPVITIGPSPLSALHRRIYVLFGDQANRIVYKLAYCDFTTEMLATPVFQPTWTITDLNYFIQMADYSVFKTYPTLLVQNHKVIICGFSNAKDDIVNPANGSVVYPAHNLFFLVNSNYGSGNWQVNTFDNQRSINPPFNQGGVMDPAYVYATSFRIRPGENKRFTATVSDNKVHLPALYQVGFSRYGQDVWYMPLSQTVKDLTFNLTTQSLKVTDLYPRGHFPNDNQPLIPWDYDENGIPDQFYNNSSNPNDSLNGQWLYNTNMYPYMHYNIENSGNYHNMQICANPQKGWLAVVWQDSYKSLMDHTNETNDDYDNVPEIFISVSNDNGLNWSDPIVLNSINTPALQTTIPSYLSVAPIIQPVDQRFGLLNLIFTDDLSYGNFLLNDGDNLGGKLKFTSLKIDFTPVINDTLSHFEPVWTGVPVDSMLIRVNNCLIDGDSLSIGDEIALFDGNLCVGLYRKINALRDTIYIQASKNTNQSGTPNGFTEGHSIVFKLWRHELQREFTQSVDLQVSYLTGGSVFHPNSFSQVNITASSTLPQVSIPHFSYPDGTYDNPLDVVISTTTSDSQVHYTLDGTEPTLISPLYAVPVHVNHTLVLKARAYKTGYAPSEADSVKYIITSGNQDNEQVFKTDLYSVYPNPFNPSTTVSYSLKGKSRVKLIIYNIKGQRIRLLQDKEQDKGKHQIIWNGQDDHNRQMSSGLYLCRMEADGYRKTVRMILLK